MIIILMIIAAAVGASIGVIAMGLICRGKINDILQRKDFYDYNKWEITPNGVLIIKTSSNTKSYALRNWYIDYQDAFPILNTNGEKIIMFIDNDNTEINIYNG